MNLTIDIGNSALKFALFDGDHMVVHASGIEELTAQLPLLAQDITTCMISSVAEHDTVTQLLKKLNIPFTILSPLTPVPVTNLYQSPDTLGADRLTLAVASHYLFGGQPSLIIGAGTCITYNFIEGGSFIGGAISPGITMRFKALEHYTSRLPLVDWSSHRHEEYMTLTGTDSEQSITSGVLNGVLNEVNGAIEAYKSRYSDLRVAITGGDGDFLVKNLKNDIFARPDMVLEGLNYILLHNA